MDEKVHLFCSRHWRERNRLKAIVRVEADGQILFADTLYLDSAKDRTEFAEQAAAGSNDLAISPKDVEKRLLLLLQRVEDDLGEQNSESELEEESTTVDGRPRCRGGYVLIQVPEGGQVLGRPKRIEGKDIPLAIATFDAQVTEEILLDEGAGPPQLELRIQGSDEHGYALPPVVVLGSQFNSLEWLSTHWGLRATVFAGQKEHVGIAIKLLSGDVPRRTLFGHSGFREVDGQLVFLHAGGALGTDGPVEGLEVALPEKLRRYNLPVPTADPVRAISFLMGLIDVASRRVTLMLLALMVSSPLYSSLGGIASIVLLGETGKLKSTLIALFMHIYGGPYSAQTPTTTWQDTANSLERDAHLLKDLPFWVDDIRPTSTRREREQQHQSVQRLLRNVVTQAGRSRLRSDLRAAPTYRPRGPVITSAEELPDVSSTLARTLIVRVGEVNLALLEEAQRLASELLPLVGASWVQFLIREMDTLVPLLRKEAEQYRNELLHRYPDMHRGIAESSSRLAAIGHAFFAFAATCGAIEATKADALQSELMLALEATALDTSEYVSQARPSLAFIEALQALLATKRVVLCGITQATVLPHPAHNAELLGWVTVRNEQGEQTYIQAQGAVEIGWFDHSKEVVYLDPVITMREVAAYTRDLRAGVPLNREAIYRQLETQGALAEKGASQHTVVKKVGRQSKRVLALRAEALFGDVEEAAGGQPSTEPESTT